VDLVSDILNGKNDIGDGIDTLNVNFHKKWCYLNGKRLLMMLFHFTSD
jgi:hypothetical protein